MFSFHTIHIILLFFHFTFGDVRAATGDSFSDKLLSHDEDFWTIAESKGTVECFGYIGGCVVNKKGLLRFSYISPGTSLPDTNVVQIQLRNNCQAKSRCCNDNYCTTYTSTALVSKHTYAYGSFWFMMRPAHIIWKKTQEEVDKHFVRSCVGLEGSHLGFHDAMILGIYLCFLSRDPSSVQFLVQYGDRTARNTVRLNFETQNTIVMWRIEWMPDIVKLYMNEDMVSEIKNDHGIMVPDNFLRIRMMLLPDLYQAGDQQPPPNMREADGRFRATMNIMHVAYQKAKVAPEHIELLTLPENSDLMSIFGIVILGIAIVGFVYISRDTFQGSKKVSQGGTYVLLNSDEETFTFS